MITLALIDFRKQILPDQLTLPLLWLGLMVNWHHEFTDPTGAILGAATGYLSLWSIFWLFKLMTGKDGMGYGDFKLNAALGAWLGWEAIPLIVFLSSTLGAVIGCCGIIFAARARNAPLAFGPYLCIAGWAAMLWGDRITAYVL